MLDLQIGNIVKVYLESLFLPLEYVYNQIGPLHSSSSRDDRKMISSAGLETPIVFQILVETFQKDTSQTLPVISAPLSHKASYSILWFRNYSDE